MIASGEIGVTITGRGFGNNKDRVSVTVGGTGISVQVDQVTSDGILATFTIGSNAERDNHTVTVRVNGVSSNSVDFFVQVPTRLRRDNTGGLVDQQGGCGVTRTLEYTLLDQAGQPIITNAILSESHSNYNGPEGLRPPEAVEIPLNNGGANDRVGYLTADSDCPPPFTASLTQAFTVKVNNQVYNLTTTNSITLGRDASGAKSVNITMTRQ